MAQEQVKIPTVENKLKELIDFSKPIDISVLQIMIQLAMIEFAKLHVTAALKTASKLDFESITHPEANDYEQAVEMTVLECYPLENIK